MKKFLSNLFLIGLIFTLIYLPIMFFVIPHLIERVKGPSTEKQIRTSFYNAKNKNYKLLILGNSTTYRGINPKYLSESSYNFSHDDDSFNQIFHKLKWVERKKIKYLILGLDYFQFSFISDKRNYIYNDYFDKTYQEIFPKTNKILEFLSSTKVLEFNRLKYLRTISDTKVESIFLKENGQYVKHGIATKKDEYFYSLNRLSAQEKYFESILDYCKKRDITVFLCMLPKRKKVLESYDKTDIIEFHNYINSFLNDKIHFLNFSKQKGWSLNDFTDITHLNEKASNRFTKMLNIKINNIKKRNY